MQRVRSEGRRGGSSQLHRKEDMLNPTASSVAVGPAAGTRARSPEPRGDSPKISRTPPLSRPPSLLKPGAPSRKE